MSPFAKFAAGSLMATLLLGVSATGTAPANDRTLKGEKISLIGDVDLDGDGASDREMFHKVLQAAGIEVEVEVNDSGERQGETLSAETKFLVIGDIPDSRLKRNRAEREQVEKVMGQLRDLRKEARLRGVRIISLNDFLEFIGQPKANLAPVQTTPPRIDFRQLKPAEARIETALNEATEISFVDTSLRDALDYIEDLHNFEIFLDHQEILDSGVDLQMLRVSLELSGVTLESALNRMLEPLKLDYLIDDELLVVTTRAKAAEHREVRVYNLEFLRPLIGEIDFDDSAEVERHTKVIQDAVAWNAAGPGVTISLTPAGLVVRHNQRTHREIVELLNQLHRAAE